MQEERYTTKERIQKVCTSPAGQACIEKFIDKLENQGITQMFIDFSKVESLGCKLLKTGIILNTYTRDDMRKRFLDFWTDKIVDFFNNINNIEDRDEDTMMAMLEDLVGEYFLKPMRPVLVYKWLLEFSIIVREELYDSIYQACFTGILDINLGLMYNQELRIAAIPATYTVRNTAVAKWIEENQDKVNYVNINFILANIDFDRYYNDVFDISAGSIFSKDALKRLCEYTISNKMRELLIEETFDQSNIREPFEFTGLIWELYEEREYYIYQLFVKATILVKEMYSGSQINRDLVDVHDEFLMNLKLVKEPIEGLVS